MKKALAWLLVLAMTAALAVGGTLAYLTDTDEDVNVMTVGQVKIDQLEYERTDVDDKDADAELQEFHNNKPLYPAVNNGDWSTDDAYVDFEQIGKDDEGGIWNPETLNNEQDKMVFVKNKGDFDAYVRTVFAFEAGDFSYEEFQKYIHLNTNAEEWTWEFIGTPVEIGEGTYFIAMATYNKVLKPGELTEVSLLQLALDPTATNEAIAALGDTYQVLVQSQAVQADGFENPATALDEAFGKINVNAEPPEIPFDDDNPINGTGLYNALHYLNSNPTGTDITAKVNTVTFGLNKDHAAITSANKGYLVDVEQDTDAYAYYVENGSGYDVYVLSDDVVYAPKDSTALFNNMSALTTVNTGILDVSRAETFLDLFRNCSRLTSVDVTGWDTSKVTTLRNAFRTCTALKEIKGLEGWDVSSVTDMYCTFYDCDGLTELNMSGWDTGNVIRLDYAIANNDNLVTVNGTGWDLTGLETAEWTFRMNPKLKNVIGSKDWYMPNNTSLYGFFAYCYDLESVDVHNWDIPKVTKTWDMFVNCTSLITVPGIGNWDFGSVIQSISMFNGCKKLQYLDDLSGWDMRNVNDIGYMFTSCQSLTALEGIGEWQFENLELATTLFKDCKSLTELDIADWDVSKVKTFNSMFSSANQNTGNMQLKSLDISKWDTSSATTMGWMFYGCGQLTEIKFNACAMPNLTTVSHMFADCFKLEKVDFTGWSTPNLTCLDGIFNDCRVMKTVDLSMFDTSKVREFSQMFEACYSLERVVGLENFVTTSGHDFSEMFSGCGSLKELNLSSFDTRNADPAYGTYAGVENWVFLRFLNGCTSLEKITFGPYFDFDGIGNCPDGYKFSMPSASNVEGWDGKWYNVETGVGYLPSELPEKTAATYVAVNPNP